MPRREDQSDDDFIHRWSRRKAENKSGLRKKSDPVHPAGRMITDPLPDPVSTKENAAEEHEIAELRPVEEEQNIDEIQVSEAEEPDREDEMEDLESVDIDALDYNADFSRFMKPGVPEAIRRRALRRLWRTNPILANVDGLNDYDEDYTDAALAVDVLKTAHKVGRGYLSDEEVAAYDKSGKQQDEERDGDGIERDADTVDEDDIASSESVAKEDGDGDAADEAEPGSDENPQTT